MKRLISLFVLLSTSFAVAAPRVVVQPMSASVPLPGAANAALQTVVASLAVELPSTFEVDDALLPLPTKSCGLEPTCLAELAKATRCGWSLAVWVTAVDAGFELTALVVSAEKTIVRRGGPVALSALPTTELGWTEVVRQLTGSLALETLGTEAPAPLVAEAKPAEKPVEGPVVTYVPSVTRVAPAPKTSWRVPFAITSGAVAVAAGTSAITLALINFNEARALNAAMQGNLIPQLYVDRAVSLDERTVLAASLGVGAGLAAAASLAALLFVDEPVQVSAGFGPQGAGLSVRGQF